MDNKIILTHYVLHCFHLLVGNCICLRTQVTSGNAFHKWYIRGVMLIVPLEGN